MHIPLLEPSLSGKQIKPSPHFPNVSPHLSFSALRHTMQHPHLSQPAPALHFEMTSGGQIGLLLEQGGHSLPATMCKKSAKHTTIKVNLRRSRDSIFGTMSSRIFVIGSVVEYAADLTRIYSLALALRRERRLRGFFNIPLTCQLFSRSHGKNALELPVLYYHVRVRSHAY